jgi:CRP/FNR family transcriptional regulator
VTKRLAAGDVIFQQGDPCPGVFAVGRGLVRVYKVAPNGKEHVLHLAGPGGTFAEAAVIGRFDCPAYAQALEASDLAMIPAAAFLSFLESDHRACIDLLVGISSWLHHVVDLLEDVVLRDAAGRVSRHLLAHAGPDGVVHLPGARKLLANQLNLTPETLSRTLRRLDDDRVVSSERESIVVVDRARLEGVAAGLFPLV